MESKNVLDFLYEIVCSFICRLTYASSAAIRSWHARTNPTELPPNYTDPSL